MSKKQKLKDAKCSRVEVLSPITFKKNVETGENFEIKAYTGAIVKRWYGQLCIDVDGIQSANNLPIFRDHNPAQIVGFSKKSWKDGDFFVSGQFSKSTQAANEVKALADEGFPWQASIGVEPLKIVSLEKDGEMTVNGQVVKGPAEIWLESHVEEVSFVPIGADSNTEVATFSKFTELEQSDSANTVDHKDLANQATENEAFDILKTADEYQTEIEIEKITRTLS